VFSPETTSQIANTEAIIAGAAASGKSTQVTGRKAYFHEVSVRRFCRELCGDAKWRDREKTLR
jgi:predicted kinase